MKLFTLLSTIDYVCVAGTLDKDIDKLVYHSDKATNNSLFFAVSGESADGRDYINNAIEKGASAVVFSGKTPNTAGKNITLIEVEDVRLAMAHIASEFYGNPSTKLLVIGITGTKGKTTTAFMVHRILENAGIKTGLIGTVFNGFGDSMKPSDKTTPESVDIQEILAEMVREGCKAVVIEVSSQGLKHKRVEKTDFDIAVFTNISPDHIGPGEHDSYEEYRAYKSKLFAMCRRAVINIDQREWPQMTAGSHPEKIIFYGTHEEADFCIGKRDVYKGKNCLGTEFLLYSSKPCGDDKQRKIFLNMPGNFNVYNGTAAVAVTKSLGIPWSVIEETLKTVTVPGRTQIIPYCDDFTVLVDYAHNGAAAENLLECIKEYNPKRLIVVFGCGGNRDRQRRFEMAQAVSKYADLIIVTSDNPRLEDQALIAADIESHISGHAVLMKIPQRREAIERALQEGQKGDIIIFMGKGHETYQIIGNNIYHFDDREEILKVKERNKL